MTGPAHDMDDEGGALPLVAEYALGLLDAKDHADMAARIAADPALRRELAMWQEKLAALDSHFAEVTPPPDVLARVEARLFADRGERAGLWVRLWENVSVWRGLTAGALAIAVAAIGFSLWPVLIPAGLPATPQYAATLAAQNSSVSFLAVYDPASATVRLRGLSGQPVAGKAYELWYIKGKAAPVSLGLVPVDARSSVVLPKPLRAGMGPDVTLAVTLEPEGGAPNGKPTGPLVAAGAVARI